MRLRVGLVVAAALGVLPAASAFAQDNPARRAPATSATGADVPAAEQPLVRKIPTPVLAVEGGVGAVGFLAGPAAVGPAWNVRVTGNLTNRFAVEANYLGSVNKRTDQDASLVMTAFDGDVRYNILRGYEAPVQPFVTAGLGWAGFGGPNGDAFSLTIPLSVGAERMITPNIKAGARLEYRPALFDHLGPPTQPTGEQPGADTWALLAHLGGAF